MVSIARDGEWGSDTLTRAVEQLRLYKAAELLIDDQIAPKRAAVLICLFEAAGEIRVILTKRAISLSTHSGEVALPGGKRDESDANDAATAVREAYEEIGLEPASIQVVASLEPFLSKHFLRVTPVVAILPDAQSFVPCCNQAEVESLFDAPLEMFLRDEKHRSEQHNRCGGSYMLHYFELEYQGNKYVIWGLTAAILIRAASIVFQRPPEFEEFCPDFRSIHRYLVKQIAMKSS
ncbi:hypothetical protein SELMODRAFT_151789 [Selaginella moellendorffii]|uniref:Nudix hydrolase domain-containing protein n=1 Tax=Selaginella moellendorffii TaxID=88036 RepID=D8S1P9_SELML|nr:nudix hydrolase 15, mitochondrial [Selaginella moellendorffii]EFJ21742.1 hypothetical protein SELMODRAFT_151789 [Selaginella moellendorffii]|eukprot:XP_002977133.1 nudix hydrolase 15, mitochondrial [Selaginella moellendorffii]